MTPAIKVLKKHNSDFILHKYKHDTSCTNYGDEAVEKLSLDKKRVFKTLLVELTPKQLVVCVVPVENQLNLRQVAIFFKAKKALMADKQEAQKVTGYLLGGISPLGQKKRLKTLINKSATSFDTIYISGGKRGLEIELKAQDLVNILDATYELIVID